MNARYFLNERLEFLRQLYTHSTSVYVGRIRMIEAEKPPYEPYYDESGEPPHLEAWLQADESIEVIGQACLSMLASTLHVYLMTLCQLVGGPIDKTDFKKGWLVGYTQHLRKHANIPFDECPVNLVLLEELVLARNRVQHPESITTMSAAYSQSDLEKVPHPFFLDPIEASRLTELDNEDEKWLIRPAIKITPEKFEEAVATVERLGHWLEGDES